MKTCNKLDETRQAAVDLDLLIRKPNQLSHGQVTYVT